MLKFWRYISMKLLRDIVTVISVLVVSMTYVRVYHLGVKQPLNEQFAGNEIVFWESCNSSEVMMRHWSRRQICWLPLIITVAPALHFPPPLFSQCISRLNVFQRSVTSSASASRNVHDTRFMLYKWLNESSKVTVTFHISAAKWILKWSRKRETHSHKTWLSYGCH